VNYINVNRIHVLLVTHVLQNSRMTYSVVQTTFHFPLVFIFTASIFHLFTSSLTSCYSLAYGLCCLPLFISALSTVFSS